MQKLAFLNTCNETDEAYNALVNCVSLYIEMQLFFSNT